MIRWRRGFAVIGLTGTICGMGFGQPTSRVSPSSTMTLAEREKLARPRLLHAETFAAHLSPLDRSLLLYRTAGAWLALDKAHAVRLYREAFSSARDSGATSLYPYVENAILNDLLPLSPSDVLDVLSYTGSKTQARLYWALINFTIMQSDYSTAVHVFDQACATGHFNQQAATYLIANLGDNGVLVAPFVSSDALRTHVFNSALQTYKQKAPSEVEPWTASRLIARFETDFPSDVILPAIDIVLEQAEKSDKVHQSQPAGMGSGSNNVSYNSRYDLELFVLGPALQRFAPDRAASLFAEHPKVAEDLKRFPKGLLSVDLGESYPTSYRLRGPSSERMPNGLQLYNSEKGAHSAGLDPMDMGLEFTIPLDLNAGLGVTGSGVFYAAPGSPESEIYKQNGGCSGDLERSLTLSRSVPLTNKVPTTCGGPTGQMCNYDEEFPRANLLEAMAQSCATARNQTSAEALLQEEMELVSRMGQEKQTGYLAMAADLYLRLGDKEHAASVVKEGFVTANKLRQRDLSEPRLKDTPKELWAAAETYRRMITLGVNARFVSTEAMVQQIPDPVLREYEEIMVARALLGVPIRRYVVLFANGSMVGEVDISYDRF
jgi:hypothetical protein